MIHIAKTARALGLAALVAPSAWAQQALTLAWDAPTDGPAPEGYKLYASQEPGKYDAPPIGATTNLSLRTPTLPLGTWHFVAKSYIGNVESEPSNEVSATTLVGPTNLRLESATNHMFPMKLVWDKSSSSSVFGDVKYRIYRRNRFPETSTWHRITETLNTYYSAQVLQAGQFVYRVSALKQNVESNFSSNDIFVRVELAAKEER